MKSEEYEDWREVLIATSIGRRGERFASLPLLHPSWENEKKEYMVKRKRNLHTTFLKLNLNLSLIVSRLSPTDFALIKKNLF
jgi:hypothetical protein